MVTLPKRKLPKLWYSKNDYKKERENESTKLSEQPPNDDTSKAAIIDETAEPLRVENQTQPNITDNNVPQTNDANPPDETEIQSATGSEESTQPNETIAAPNEKSLKELENDNKLEPQLANELTSPQCNIQENLANNENKPGPLAASSLLENSQEIIESPKENENKETTLELQTNTIAIERPVQTETIEIPVETFVEELTPTDVAKKVELTESGESTGKNTDTSMSLLPTRAIVCIGEYPINIVLKSAFSEMKDQDVLPIFVEKSLKDVIKWSQGRFGKNNIISLDDDIDTHFWYNILPHIIDNEIFFSHIQSMPIEKLRSAIFVSATWSWYWKRFVTNS